MKARQLIDMLFEGHSPEKLAKVRARDEEIRSRIKAGETKNALAREYGLDNAYVYRISKDLNLTTNDETARKERNASITARLQKGERPSDLAREYGVSPSVITKLLPPEMLASKQATKDKRAYNQEQVLKLSKEGKTQTEIADILGISLGAVNSMYPAEHKDSFSHYDKMKMYNMHKSGLSFSEISRRLGVSDEAVSRNVAAISDEAEKIHAEHAKRKAETAKSIKDREWYTNDGRWRQERDMWDAIFDYEDYLKGK